MSLLHLFKLSTLEAFGIIISILFLIDTILWFAFRNFSSKKQICKHIRLVHGLISIIFYAIIGWAFFLKKWTRDPFDFSIFYLITNHLIWFYITKIILATLAVPLLFRYFKYYVKFGIVITILFFLIFCYGLYFGRFNFQKNNLTINSYVLATQPLKIVQISDLHVGQFIGHENQFMQIIEGVNNEKPDIICITGDMICNFAEELKPFLPYLSKLKAKYGIYIVHGNHDYGDYFWWKTNMDKYENHELLEKFYNQLNFKLLNNSIDTITLAKQNIIIAGIENYGHKPFPQYGNIDKSLVNVDTNKFVILLAHDPFIWKTITKYYPQVKLTLSGHTHGYQFGLCNRNKCWSPFMPKKPWKGLYQSGNQFLYISAGLSSSFFSTRIGIWPEIAVITLY